MRLVGCLLVLAFAVGALASPALAQTNPFGTQVPVEPVPGFGFQALVAATAEAQRYFYEGLTGALRQVATSPAALWALLGLAFAYGVVHAAGPGHGKVVIGSYMLASGETARRGAALAVAAAFVQATMAVALVGLLAGAFGLTRQVLSDATISLERFSYILIVLLGLYLLWRGLRRLVARGVVSRPLLSHAQPIPDAAGIAAATLTSDAGHGRSPNLVVGHADHADHHQHHAHTDHGQHTGHDPQTGHGAHAGHHHHDGCGCDHAHMPDAQQVEATRGLGPTLALVLGAGARPCTGALLVLVLALGQGLFWQGAAAAYAMGAGTALTVGVLAALASGLSGLFQRFDGPGKGPFAFAPQALALLGSLIVIAFGALLLAASLAR